MNVNCPNCNKQLKLPEKIEKSVKGLAAGKLLNIKCPQCAGAIPLSSDMTLSSKPVLQPVKDKKQEKKKPRFVTPPPPPDISWLKDGRYDGKDIIEDVPMALILMNEGPEREQVIEALEGIGYKAELVESTQDAVEKIQFVDYACIVLHSLYESKGIMTNAFHRHMCTMNMIKRRFIFYILVGKEFKTFYNLQALTYSANLVVNDSEIPKFGVILRKAIPEYEELFGPIMEELRHHGR
jgi:hypothetical protein